MQHWLEKYGFAFLVFVALACAGYMAGSTQVPHSVPDFALQSGEVYRLEIGVAFFVAFYLAVMAILLALGGRGFTEFGPKGIRAETVIKQQGLMARHKEIDHQILRKLGSQERRLERLEAER